MGAVAGIWLMDEEDGPVFVGANTSDSTLPVSHDVASLFQGTQAGVDDSMASSGSCAIAHEVVNRASRTVWSPGTVHRDGILSIASLGCHHALIWKGLSLVRPDRRRCLIGSDIPESVRSLLVFSQSSRRRSVRIREVQSDRHPVGTGTDRMERSPLIVATLDIRWLLRSANVSDAHITVHDGVLDRRRRRSGVLDFMSLCTKASARTFSPCFAIPLRDISRIDDVLFPTDGKAWVDAAGTLPPTVSREIVGLARCMWMDGGESYEPLCSLFASGLQVGGGLLPFEDLDVHKLKRVVRALVDTSVPVIGRAFAVGDAGRRIWKVWIRAQCVGLGDFTWRAREREVHGQRGRYLAAENALVPLMVGPSTLGKAAGNGCFAGEFIPADTLICYYRGRVFDLNSDGMPLVEDTVGTRLFNDPANREYSIELSSRRILVVDASSVSKLDTIARAPWCAINDPDPENKEPTSYRDNVRFIPRPSAGVAEVRTTRPVFAGEELFVRYGSDYWACGKRSIGDASHLL